MSHVFHQLYYHFVWGTHDRQPTIVPNFRPELLRVLAEEVANRGGILVRQNAMTEHVHLLVRLTPNVLISDFIGQVKGSVSYRVNRETQPPFRISWQEGYGVLSLREGDVDKVSKYIDNQEDLHRRRKLSRLLETLEGA